MELNRTTPRRARRGLTLVEMIVSTVLTLMMMLAVSTLFQSVGNGITASRALLEMGDRLRLASARIQLDLAGIKPNDTAYGLKPPYNPGEASGYFELTEGPIGPVIAPEALFRDSQAGLPDTSVLDNDDMLMFTTHSDVPFVGRYAQPIRQPGDPPTVIGFRQTSIKSHDAEIVYFVRGRTLYRRILLIVPGLDLGDSMDEIPTLLGTSFYAVNDISTLLTANNKPLATSLRDLTKPEYRYAHRPIHFNHITTINSNKFPFHPHFGASWNFLGDGTTSSGDSAMPQPPCVPRQLTAQSLQWRTLGVPTLRECSWAGANWLFPGRDLPVLASFTPRGVFDLWENPNAWSVMEPTTGNLYAYMGDRVNEDVLLTNVIGFDVRVWDPYAPLVEVREGTAPPLALAPGDPGYIAAVYQVRNTNSATILGATYTRAYNRGAYVDLNYLCQLGPPPSAVAFPEPDFIPLAPQLERPLFGGPGHWRSGMRGVEPFLKTSLQNPFNTAVSGGRNLIDSSTNWIHSDFNRASVLDTWSTHYENDGVGQFPNHQSGGSNTNHDTWNDGIDSYVYDPNAGISDPLDNSIPPPSGGVDDDPEERETRAPYLMDFTSGAPPPPEARALRGIRITIRVYEPGTHQIRQRTIEHSFVN